MGLLQLESRNYWEGKSIINKGISHINIGSGEELSIHEFALMIKKIVGFEGKIKFDYLRPDGTPRKLLDTSIMNKKGWRPKINLKKGSSILIFPQGTRVPLHASTKDYPYQSGIYFLYSQCNIPVIPVAHNAGLFWPKNSFFKYPDRHRTKTVTLEIMDEIPSGLDKKTFMDRLEKNIEDKTRKLIQEESDG